MMSYPYRAKDDLLQFNTVSVVKQSSVFVPNLTIVRQKHHLCSLANWQ